MIKRTSKYLGLFFIFIIIAVTFTVMSTTAGLKIALKIASSFSNNKLVFTQVSGSLISNVNIKLFEYHDTSTTISANNVSLKIQPLLLILNDIDITEIKATDLNIQTKKQTKQTKLKIVSPKFEIPFKFSIKNAHIKHVTIINNKTPYTFDHVALTAYIKNNYIEIDQLYFQKDDSNYSIRGKAVFEPTNIAVKLTQKKQNKILFSASASATGNWENLNVQAFITSPFTMKSNATITNLMSTPSWHADGKISNLILDKKQNQKLTGSFEGHGTGKKISLNGKVLDANQTNPSTIHFQLKTENYTSSPITSMIDWHNITISSPQKNIFTSQQGKLELSGDINHYRLNGQAEVESDDAPSAKIQIEGLGNTKNLAFESIAIATLDGNITGTGSINWSSGLKSQFDLSAINLDPSIKWPFWTGTASFTTKLLYNNTNASISLSNVTGSIRKQNLSGSALFTFLNMKHYSLNTNLHLGSNNIILSLDRGEKLTASWDVGISEFNQLLPFADGSFSSRGDIGYSNESKRINSNFTGRNIKIYQYQADSFDGNIDYNTSPTKASNIQFNASNITINDYLFNALSLKAKGHARKFDLSFLGKSNDVTLLSQAKVNYLKNIFHLNFSKLSLISPTSYAWSISNPFTIDIGRKLFLLRKFNWRSNGQTIKSSLSINNKHLDSAALNVKDLNLNSINIFMPTSIRLAGVINSNINYDKAAAQGNMTISLSKSSIKYKLNNTFKTANINTGALSANLSNNTLKSKLNINFANRDYLNLSSDITNISLNHILPNDYQYKGLLRAKLSDFDFIEFVSPQLKSLTGAINANLNWNGTFSTPNLNGNIALSKGNLALPEQGLTLSNINGQSTFSANEAETKLHLTSGKGTININGTTQLSNNTTSSFTIKGKDFEIENTRNYRLVVSPSLTAKLNQKRFSIHGELHVPIAEINLKNYQDVVSLPRDVAIIKSDSDLKSTSIWKNFFANIKLILGDNVTFEDNSLTATLTGSLNLVESPNTDTRATGELTIQTGSFELLGQQLDIKNGKLVFTGGPTTNPGLNIKATKKIKVFMNPSDNTIGQQSLSTTENTSVNKRINLPMQQRTILVGVDVSNTLESPQLSLFSDQAGLDQADILSYLLLGYTIDNTNSQEKSTLLQAANALTSGDTQVGNILDKLQTTFQLSQIKLESRSYLTGKNTIEQNTSLVLGKALSPKLYLRYSIGLIFPINTIAASYELTKKWSVQTESNELGTGVDFIYSWESKD